MALGFVVAVLYTTGSCPAAELDLLIDGVANHAMHEAEPLPFEAVQPLQQAALLQLGPTA